MSSFTFLYHGNEIIIHCQPKENLGFIVQKFCQKINTDRENLNFLCNGKILDEQITEDKISTNSKNVRYVYVDDNSFKNDSKDIIIKSNIIICPQCKESASISIDNYHFIISGCKNGHITDNINIEDFANTQKINLSKIICDQCKLKNMGDTTDNLFFRCPECNKNLCILCKSGHNPKHNIINYWNKYYTCEEHSEPFISYCKDCKSNLCFVCEDKHNMHEIQSFKNLFTDEKNKSNEEIKKFRDNINFLKDIVNKFIIACNKVIESFEILYNIKKEINDNINLKQRNLQNFVNHKFLNNQIDDDIETIINEINTNNNFTGILNIYNQIQFRNYIIIKYKVEKDQKEIKIFDEEFVNNNKSLCKILYDNEEHKLSAHISKDKIKNIENDIFTIKLTGIENIINAKNMFYKCTSLIELPDICYWNTKNVTKMSCMFSRCSSLKSLPDISKWDISKVTTLNCMFSRCVSLISLPDISNWNIKSITDIGYIFRGCSSLKSIPEISKWNTINVQKINGMFDGCSSLVSVPDISKWNIDNSDNNKNMEEIYTDQTSSIITKE